MNYLGIDPGKNGACVLLNSEGKVVNQIVMPVFGKELDIHFFAGFIKGCYESCDKNMSVFIEEVHAIHGSSAGNTFEFGQAFMMCKAVCAALQIPYQTIKPKTWQKIMYNNIKEIRKKPTIDKNGKKRKGKLDTKKMSLVSSKRKFPLFNNLKSKRCSVPHDGLVDAVLIAEAGRILYG